jgi:hypothetical protein
MKRLTVMLALAFAASFSLAAPAALAGTGNGAPSGPHFNLNIHGVANGQGFNGSNQNDIFVPLKGSCKINLVQNPLVSPFNDSFGVTQPDCVNNPTATFSLPAPCSIDNSTGLCSTGSTYTYYSVWARALGTPGGSANTQTCAYTDSTQTTYVCSLNMMVAVRGTGGSKFTDVSKCLLFLNNGTNNVPLFSNQYYSYYWQYDNEGLRLLQLRFYQVPVPIPTSTTATVCNVN